MGLSNYLPNSRINQPGVCTSSTRPASPYEGQVIYETDTDRVLVWNGTAWVDLSTGKAGQSGLTLITSGTSSGTTAYNYDNVFTSDFQNYKILLDRISISVTARALRLQFRYNGTTNSDANYNYGYVGYKANATTNNAAGANQTFAEVGVYIDTSADFQGGCSVIDVFSPLQSNRTKATVAAQGFEGSSYWRAGGFEQYSNNPFDGFRITLSSTGNISYTYAIYGYN
jgi:hypothetical protein